MMRKDSRNRIDRRTPLSLSLLPRSSSPSAVNKLCTQFCK
jgi:hypothetical protein